MILGLTFSVRKHRFGADLRTNFLYDIGQDKERFPLMSQKGLDYFRKRKERTRRRDGWFITWSSEVNLIWFIFFTAVLLSALCISEVILTLSRIGLLVSEGIPPLDILRNVTSSNLYIKEIMDTVVPSTR